MVSRKLPSSVESKCIHEVDIHVGSRVRLRRRILGKCQTKLGDALGLTFQQIQKYENGSNRISANRLFEISQILSVEPEFFFLGLPTYGTSSTCTDQPVDPDEQGITQSDPEIYRSGETLAFVRAYYLIRDKLVRTRVFKLVKSLGNEDEGD
ncbi:MAG: helix-turn-helix domain-containing protein [Alphaproteobacteria bacterium]